MDIEHDTLCMLRALELARRGLGAVEPNPMVGAVVERDGCVVGEGFHERFGHAHAEVNALAKAGPLARGSTLYVTLEPCSHHGKTPPCTRAIIEAGVHRVVVAMEDPFPEVSGRGLQALTSAGVQVSCGLLELEARHLNAPYLKLLKTGKPWVIAKWAMTLDGKIATRTGESRWISSAASREIVHQLRGRMDAVIVGRGTAQADDPQLTARPPGARTAVRIVLDTCGQLSSDSQLVRTAGEVPVLVAVGPQAAATNRERLKQAGCEVFEFAGKDATDRVCCLLDELGRRRMTNVLVEGGSTVLGAFLDASQIDEAHVFVAPKIVGGAVAPSAIAGVGFERMAEALQLTDPVLEQIGGDLYLHGRVSRRA